MCNLQTDSRRDSSSAPWPLHPVIFHPSQIGRGEPVTWPWPWHAVSWHAGQIEEVHEVCRTFTEFSASSSWQCEGGVSDATSFYQCGSLLIKCSTDVTDVLKLLFVFQPLSERSCHLAKWLIDWASASGDSGHAHQILRYKRSARKHFGIVHTVHTAQIQTA